MSLHFSCHFEGVPVYATEDADVLADSRGVWPWKKIVVGPFWHRLELRERIAVLLHELHHVRRFHVEQRVLALPLVWTRWARRWTAEQEFASDAFAAANGFGLEMVQVIRALHREQAPAWHPLPGVRIQRLMTAIDRYNHAT